MNIKAIALIVGLIVVSVVAVGFVSDDTDATNVSTYDQLEQALAYGGEVVLQDDITLEKDQIITVTEGSEAVLDLNGMTITVASDYVGWAIVNHGMLTVLGDGTIDVSASFDGYGAFLNYGDLTIEDGTYTGKTIAGYYYGVLTNNPDEKNGGTVRNYGFLTIDGGSYHGTPRALHNLGTAYVNGGTFTGDSCSAHDFVGKNNEDIGSLWSYTIGNNSPHSRMYFNGGTVTGIQGAISAAWGEIVINGGSFSTYKCSDHPYSSFHACYIAGDDGIVEGQIYGGTFYSVAQRALYIGNNTPGDGGENAPAAATVSGGVFKTATSSSPVYVDGTVGDAVISGGQFRNNATDINDDGNVCLTVGSNNTPISDFFPEGSNAQIDEETGIVTHTHVASTVRGYDEDNHWFVCQYCSKPVDATPHEYGTPYLLEYEGYLYNIFECVDCDWTCIELYGPAYNPPIWDDDDEYIPPIAPVQPADSDNDDTTTIVACAAAAVVAALMAVYLIIDRRH